MYTCHLAQLANFDQPPHFPHAQDIRQAKMRKQLDLLKSGSIAVQMNNLTDMEINAFRTFVIQAINTFERLYDGVLASSVAWHTPLAPLPATSTSSPLSTPTPRC